MNYSLARLGFSSLFLWAMLAMPASALERTAKKYKFNLPPSADLSYSIKALQSGLTITGEALIRWNAGSGKYSVLAETRAMLIGKILEDKSEGAVDVYGIAPAVFSEKRLRKDATVTTFNREAKTISFNQSSETYPIVGGEQDRTSAIWQLIAVARGTPAKFKPGSTWTFFVAGQRDAEPWTFKVTKQEKIRTPLGEMNALHIVKLAAPDSKKQQVDIWLAPSQEWYPVKLRYSEPDGEYIEQALEKISKK